MRDLEVSSAMPTSDAARSSGGLTTWTMRSGLRRRLANEAATSIASRDAFEKSVPQTIMDNLLGDSNPANCAGHNLAQLPQPQHRARHRRTEQPVFEAQAH